jgi:hypothetical protein
MIKRGDPGIEPGTSCTLNRNHTTRPIALIILFCLYSFKQLFEEALFSFNKTIVLIGIYWGMK